MTSFYAEDYINGNGGTLTQSQYKTAIEATRSIMYETPGGGPEESLTLASFTITPSHKKGPTKMVDTQGGASTDDLKTIAPTNCRDGQIMFIRSTSALRIVRVFNGVGGTGQIFTVDGAHYSLTDPKQFVCLKYRAAISAWEEVFRSQPVPNRIQGATSKTSLTVTSNSITPTVTSGHLLELTPSSGTNGLLKYIDDTNIPDGAFYMLKVASGKRMALQHLASGGTGNQRQISLQDSLTRFLSGNETALFYKNGTIFYEVTSWKKPVLASFDDPLRYCRIGVHPYPQNAADWIQSGSLTAVTAGPNFFTQSISSGTPGTNTSRGYVARTLQTAATANANGNIQSLQLFPTRAAQSHRFVIAGSSGVTTSQRIWCGAAQTTTNLPVTDSFATSGAAFRYSTSAGDTNWQCIAFGTAATTVDSGVAFVDGTDYTLEIVISSTSVVFFINGVIVAEITTATALPAAAGATNNLGVIVGITALAASARTISILSYSGEVQIAA